MRAPCAALHRGAALRRFVSAAPAAARSLRCETRVQSSRTPAARTASAHLGISAAITAHYPELIPYLAPVTPPAVAEARVIAMTHATFGAVPAAEIVPKDPAAPPKNIELNTLCRSQLSNYKIPLKYTLVAALPKTPSGKILR